MGRRVVLAVHRGGGYAGSAASDRCTDAIAAMVYVDTAPGKGAMDPDFADAEKPLPSPEELAESENLDGLSEGQLATFRERAVPQPGGTLREAIELTNEARLDIPSTMICTAYTAAEYQEYAKQGMGFLAGLLEVRNVTYVDLPTSHWPMWSRPAELARIIGEVATAQGDA